LENVKNTSCLASKRIDASRRGRFDFVPSIRPKVTFRFAVRPVDMIGRRFAVSGMHLKLPLSEWASLNRVTVTQKS